MSTQSLRKSVADILLTGGIKINGPHPWDPQIHNEQFYKRVLSQGTLGLGESYMDGWWDCDQLDEFAFRVLNAKLYNKATLGWRSSMDIILAKIFNMQAMKKAAKNALHSYEIGNRLFQLMLGKRMTYSCGYWKDTDNLDIAQENKLDLVCRKLGIQPGQHVLDIGCGWGSFAKFAAERYGAKVTGVTVSPSQVELGREMCKGLNVEIRLQDYRTVNEQFDHVVAIGFTEHVGYRNYRPYMETVARCLKDDGLFLQHSICHPYTTTSIDPFTNTYIFPNAVLPSIKQIGTAIEHIFIIEDLHNFGAYYDHTLVAWFNNFNQNWDELKEEYGDRFFRMWKYYLLSNAGSFRARHNQVWQIVLSKNGVPGGYESIR